MDRFEAGRELQLQKRFNCIYACLWLWIGMFTPALAQSVGMGAVTSQTKSENRLGVQSPRAEIKVQKEQEEAQTMADNLAWLQWRRRVDATTIPKLLRMTTEVRIYQRGTDFSYLKEPLAILSESSNPAMFHLLKRSFIVAKYVPQPIDLCYMSLYQNGVLLGNLTLFFETGGTGTSRSWTFASRKFMAWLRTQEQPNGLFSAQSAPMLSSDSVPYRKGHMIVKTRRIPDGILFYGVSKPEAMRGK